MSTKNNLKNRIKKPTATQAFFKSYDTNEDNTDNVSNNENKDLVVVENETNDNFNINEDINNKVINNDINKIKNKTYDNNNNKNEIYNNDNNENDIDDNDDDEVNDYLRELATGKKPVKKKNKKVFTSFYMDPDLAVEVDKISARGEKGDKSKLINMGIRKLLEEYGVIEKK